jgi:Homing endonuclease associated repeat
VSEKRRTAAKPEGPRSTWVCLTANELQWLLNWIPEQNRLRPRFEKALTQATRRYWDRERIIAAMTLWHRVYGKAPCANDWRPNALTAPSNQPRLERFRSGSWPAASVVNRHFGSWNAAIEAAGFTPRSRGHQSEAAA